MILTKAVCSQYTFLMSVMCFLSTQSNLGTVCVVHAYLYRLHFHSLRNTCRGSRGMSARRGMSEHPIIRGSA